MLNKDFLLYSIKKYILRYCLGNYDIQNEALNNLTSFKDLFNKTDIFRKEILEDKRFEEEFKQLNSLNDKENNIIKYFNNLIFKDMEDDKLKKKEEEIDEEGIIDDDDEKNKRIKNV